MPATTKNHSQHGRCAPIEETIIGFGGSKNKAKTVTTQSAPWQIQAPYLENLFSRAENQYNQGALSYFPGRTVAPQSLATQNALNLQEQRAQSPESLTAQARDLNRRTMAGDFLTAESNPYLRGAVSQALDPIQARVSSTFGRGGGNNYGSSAFQEWLGKSLADTALPVYAANYQRERDRQIGAQDRAPALDVADINQLAAAGSVRDAYEQALIDAEKRRHDFTQLSPWDALQRYGTAVQGSYGGTQQQPLYPSNPYLDALGIGIGGVGLYDMGKRSGLWGAAPAAQGGFSGDPWYSYDNPALWQADYSGGFY